MGLCKFSRIKVSYLFFEPMRPVRTHSVTNLCIGTKLQRWNHTKGQMGMTVNTVRLGAAVSNWLEADWFADVLPYILHYRLTVTRLNLPVWKLRKIDQSPA